MIIRSMSGASRLIGWVFVTLAVLAQVGGAAALPQCCQTGPATLGVICGADHADGPANQAPPHRHDHDCAVCPYCAAIGVHAVLPASTPDLPLPQPGGAGMATVLPPARAPPAAPDHPGQPRAPPVLA